MGEPRSRLDDTSKDHDCQKKRKILRGNYDLRVRIILRMRAGTKPEGIRRDFCLKKPAEINLDSN